MKLTSLLVATLALCFGVSGTALAQDKSLEKIYHQDANEGFLSCSRTFTLAQKMAALSDGGHSVKVQYKDAGNYQKCILEGKDDIKASYEKFAAKVKKPSAKLALKEHYIAALSALQGVEPLSDERKMNYEKRQGENQSKLDTAWIRFETEN